ncbi:MAG: class II aldolase/adducin family protein [Candidatus Eremiobacteraeota bacterium]|nr:class II aldolase/adducin family protein [Candidatus Eremiobacteraeota bacterium]
MKREERARRDIVRCAQRLWERRLVTGTSGNVSVKLADGSLLVTPSRRSLALLGPGDIVRVAASGELLDAKGLPSSELPLHLAAYRARSDAACVVHTHPTFCVVWSRQGRVFPQDTVGARETLGPVGWVPYRPPGSQELANLCAEAFATPVDVVLMERHGLSAIGDALEAAFDTTDLAEEAARVAYFGTLAGREFSTVEIEGGS